VKRACSAMSKVWPEAVSADVLCQYHLAPQLLHRDQERQKLVGIPILCLSGSGGTALAGKSLHSSLHKYKKSVNLLRTPTRGF